MYVGKITFCFASVRPYGACAQQNSRKKSLNSAEFRDFFRTLLRKKRAKPFFALRSGWDSNPRDVSVKLISSAIGHVEYRCP